MDDSEPTTLILHINLGDASKFDQDIFPREYYNAGDALSKGSVLLSATLDEMDKIADLGINLKNDPRFKRDTMMEYHRLTRDENELKNRPKSFNPFTKFANYRAERLFHSASKAFYRDTMETSERIQREEAFVQVVASKELSTTDGQVSQNTQIGGIAIHLRSPMDKKNAKQKVVSALKTISSRAKALNPFRDNLHGVQHHSDADCVVTLDDTASLLSQDTLVPSSSDSRQTDLMSPGSTYHFHFHNSVLAAGSSLSGTTLNQGDGNRGSTVTEQPDP